MERVCAIGVVADGVERLCGANGGVADGVARLCDAKGGTGQTSGVCQDGGGGGVEAGARVGRRRGCRACACACVTELGRRWWVVKMDRRCVWKEMVWRVCAALVAGREAGRSMARYRRRWRCGRCAREVVVVVGVVGGNGGWSRRGRSWPLTGVEMRLGAGGCQGFVTEVRKGVLSIAGRSARRRLAELLLLKAAGWL
jgi:hypothetical protein